MSEFNLDLDIPQDVLDAAQTGFLFAIPSDAAVKGNPQKPDGGIAVWAQTLEVVASAMEQDENDSETVQVVVDYQVPADAMRGDTADPNAGRTLKQWYRITPAAFGNKQHKKFKGTMFNLGRLKALLSGAGYAPQGGNIRPYFAGQQDGTLPFIVGKVVATTMKRSWYEGKAKDEVTDFVAFDIAGA